MAASYCTPDELREWMGANAVSFEARAESIIESASREIDAHCGRRFYVDDTATARTFLADSPDLLVIDDCAELTALSIDGVSVSISNYDRLPLNGIEAGVEGWPATALGRLDNGTVFFDRCTVTGRWGWLAVPPAVKTACLMLSAETFKAQEAPFGVAGVGAMGEAVRVSRYMNPLIAMKLRPFKRSVLSRSMPTDPQRYSLFHNRRW